MAYNIIIYSIQGFIKRIAFVSRNFGYKSQAVSVCLSLVKTYDFLI